MKAASTESLATIRGNLLAGLERIAEHVDAGTFHTVGGKGKAPPAQSGQTTLALLNVVEAELTERHAMPKPTAFICDIDGTLADMGKGPDGKPLPGRRGPYDWGRVSEDTPIWPVIGLVQCIRRSHRALFVSGRDEICRDRTQHWLDDTVIYDERDRLFMRAHKDNRPDHEVKLEIYERDIKPHYDVKWVIDDRNAVVTMWRSLGLTVLQVADGDF